MTMFSANTQMSQNTLLYILYGGLIVFMLYKQVKNFKEKQKITGSDRHEFSRKYGKWVYSLGLLILVFGVVNVFDKQIVSGLLMIAVVLLLFVDLRDKLILTENGVYSQGKYVLWDSIKKWGFDEGTSDLVAKYKEGYEEKSLVARIEKNDMAKINDLIRKFKLHK